jgi:hypothetical protein
MFTFSTSRRQADRPSARLPRARRPLVEDLEGRRLLSGIIGNHIGTSVSAEVVVTKPVDLIVGNHIGTSVNAAIQGNHIGTNVA